jgi:hypothetical protein
MISWFLNNSQSIVAVLELAGLAVMGFFVFTGFFGSKTNDRRSESDKVADGLIGRLQLTVDQNAKDMAAMVVRIDAQQKEIHQLQGQNDAYLKIITLREPAVAKVFDDAPAIFAIARENNQYSKANNEAIKNLTNTIEMFINRLPPLMPSMTA